MTTPHLAGASAMSRAFKLPSREASMTPRRGMWSAALMLLTVRAASESSQAQELREDVRSNGVRLGAGTGAAAGAVLGLVTEEICSPGACAVLGAVAGGLIGLVIDSKIGRPRPVAPGSLIDDRLVDGALFGALSGVGVAVVEASFRCRPGPDRPPCTRNGILLNMSRAAQWMALVGLLIDAAVPSRLEGPDDVRPERSRRRFGFAVNLRF